MLTYIVADISHLTLLSEGVLILSLIIFFVILFISLNKKKYQARLKKQTLQSEFQQELLRTRLEIQEEALRNIHEEIHENIGQSLSVVKLNLNTVDPYNMESATGKLDESKTQLTKAIQDLRDITRSLNSDYVKEAGLQAAIEHQLQLIEKFRQYHIGFSVTGSVFKNSDQLALLVYRAVQELLTNIIKHSGASNINIEMQYLTEKLIIKVNDNGHGFDAMTAVSESNKVSGLQNIRNRIKMINGTIMIHSIPGKGTTAVIELPKTPLP